MEEESRTVDIRDLGLVAALVTCGFEIVFTHRDDKDRVHFVFEETIALDRTVEDYYADSLQVKARKFFDNTKMLKARIYGER
jgi:hypothetical protein